MVQLATTPGLKPLTALVSLALLVGACAPAAMPSPTAKAPAAAAPAAAPAAPAAKPAEPAAKPAAPAEAKPAEAKPAEAKPAAQPAAAAEWVVAMTGESACFDPSTCSTAGIATWNNRNIFEPLVTFEGDALKIVPRIGESWNRVDDRTIDIAIRKYVKFHNGDPLTAEDVKYSLDLTREEASTRRIYTKDITSVEVQDPNTIRLRTQGPSAELMTNLSQLFIVPKNHREKVGKDAFSASPVGTGPYKFVQFVQGQRLSLEANPDYWRGRITPQKLTLRPMADPATRVAELKTGGVQIIAAPPLTQLKELDQGETQVVALKGAKTIMYPFNSTKKPFDDVRVRQAVNYAVDRESIVKNVLEGNAVLSHGPWGGPAWPGYDPNLKPYAYDVAKAKQLLADAGYSNGFETTLNFTNGTQLKDRDIAEVMVNQLGEVGIKVRLIPTDSGKLNDDWKAGNFEGITQVFWSAPSDPGPMITYSFDKVKGQKEDEKLNGLVEQSRRTVDPDQRAAVLKEMGQYANDQALWLFMHAQNEFYAKRRNISWEPSAEYTFGSVLWYQVTPR